LGPWPFVEGIVEKAMVTFTDVKALVQGGGRRPDEDDDQTVFNIVLERFMEERGIETYDDLYSLFTEAGYELDLETFLEECQGTSGLIYEKFVGGVATARELDREEMSALAWANVWGREPIS
jgi:hypothetical protein